ncbi:MAG TPA: L,D-transpeptidase family protein [Sphingomicrobium sp.]|nr:L,D-transpeptidase family protein [Sphingomicrobium sp.]
MRIHILLASCAIFAIASACDSSPVQMGGDNSGSAQSDSAAWNNDAEKQLMAALDAAPKHGLTKDLFLKGELPSDDAERSRALARIAMDYASALAMGKVDPAKLREVYTVPRPKVDVAAGLRQAIASGKLGQWLDSLAPQTDEYRALGQAFMALVQRSPDLPDNAIPSGKAIKRGGSDPRLPAIVRNLQSLGYLPAGEDAEDDPAATAGLGGRYTPVLAQAVARYQADSGLKPDGIIGDDTIAALNEGPRDRARALAVAMERLRWLDRNPPKTRVDVNVAATLLDYYRDGQHRSQRHVVAGQPGWETPQLGAPIFQLVANPTWTVPKSIIEKEISKKGPGYLAANNLSWKDGKLVQASGPKNSLGLVKFDMKDDEAIYLHDTPAKALFAADQRHESHGCVRVQGALDFARELAAADGVLPEFDKALASGDETFVDLETDIPVRLMYHTAWLGADGRVHFAADAYGWDNDVATALGYPTKAPVEFKTEATDFGP